jgi:hypothetical protein
VRVRVCGVAADVRDRYSDESVAIAHASICCWCAGVLSEPQVTVAIGVVGIAAPRPLFAFGAAPINSASTDTSTTLASTSTTTTTTSRAPPLRHLTKQRAHIASGARRKPTNARHVTTSLTTADVATEAVVVTAAVADDVPRVASAVEPATLVESQSMHVDEATMLIVPASSGIVAHAPLDSDVVIEVVDESKCDAVVIEPSAVVLVTSDSTPIVVDAHAEIASAATMAIDRANDDDVVIHSPAAQTIVVQRTRHVNVIVFACVSISVCVCVCARVVRHANARAVKRRRRLA